MTVRPAPDCHLFALDDGAILFCEGQQKLFAMNTTAALTWLGMEEHRDESAIAQDLATAFNSSTQLIMPDIERLLAQWWSDGLLAGTEDLRKAGTRPQANPLPSVAAPRLPVSWHSERRYCLLDTAFKILFGDAEQESWVHPVLAHLESQRATSHDSELQVVRTEDGLLMLRNGSPEVVSSNLEGLAPAIKAYMLRTSLNNYPYLFQIHAGVVERKGTCLLLPGVAGSGKSSLTAALVHAGWRYLSDETAPMEENALHIRPVPLALASKTGGWEIMEAYFPGIGNLNVHVREDAKRVRYLTPSPVSIAPDRPEGYAVRHIVFPHYDPRARTELSPLSKVETIGRLLPECLSLPRQLDQAKVAKLVDWAEHIDGHYLPYSDLGEAVALINKLYG